ncbi:unnamed protein product [Sphagnum jensenii]|uniref:Uncharacterized protein n=1 Tax=Sphagnum jensenii TaxID=128206 RepID=A0ABP0VG83_9BRYO
MHDAAEDAISKRALKSDGTGILSLTTNPMYLGGMIPQANVDHTLNMRVMDDCWTFLLIVTNDTEGPGALQRRMSDHQDIYTGYFIGEPTNPHYHGQMTLNDNAQMIVTHRTAVGKTTVVGSYGAVRNTIAMNDFDVVYPKAYLAQSDTPTSLLRPSDLSECILSDYDGWTGLDSYGHETSKDSLFLPDPRSQLDQLDGPVNIPSRIGVPRTNIAGVMDSIASAKRIIQVEATSGRAIMNFGRDALYDLTKDNLKQNDTCRPEAGLKTDMVLSLGGIIQKYHLDSSRINILRQGRTPEYDPINQNTQSTRNVFSAMLAGIIPAIMVELLISEVTFVYDSHVKLFNFGSHYAMLTPIPENEARQRLEGFRMRLEAETFPILATRGDFSLNMACSCGGTTAVVLNFYDESRTPEVYEVPTIFGGMNNMLVGSGNSFKRNAAELGQFIKIVAGGDTDKPAPLSEYDDRRLTTALAQIGHNSSDWSQPSTQAPSPANIQWNI